MTLIVATTDDMPITWPKALKKIVTGDAWDSGYLGPIRVGSPLAAVDWSSGTVTAQARVAAGQPLAFTPNIDRAAPNGNAGKIRFWLPYASTVALVPGTYIIELEKDRITWFQFQVPVIADITIVP